MDGPNTLGPRIHCSWAASSEGMGGNPPCKPRVDGFLSTVERYSLPSRSESLVRLIQRRPTKRVVHEKAARPGGFDQSVPCGGFSLAARSLASRSSYICVCVFRVSFRPPRRRFSSIKAEASAWVKPNSGTPLFNPRFGFQFCIRKRYPYFPLAGVARGWGRSGVRGESAGHDSAQLLRFSARFESPLHQKTKIRPRGGFSLLWAV